nr:helix-turn-helix domain-containing protein [Bacillus fonticola]
MTELGNRLKEAREEKGYSLEDLQGKTKIQKRYLKGIEEGNYSGMPGQFYVRAFIKQYAEAVGLDPDEIFQEYAKEIPVTQQETVPEGLSRVKTRKTSTTATSSSVSSTKVLRALPTLLVAAFVIGLIFLFYYFFVINNGGESDNQTGEETPVEEGTEDSSYSENENDPNPADEEVTPDEEETTPSEETEQETTPEEEAPATTLAQVSQENGTTTYEVTGEAFAVVIGSLDGNAAWISVTNGAGETFLAEGVTTNDAGEPRRETFDFSGETEIRIRTGSPVNTFLEVNGESVAFQEPVGANPQNIVLVRATQ